MVQALMSISLSPHHRAMFCSVTTASQTESTRKLLAWPLEQITDTDL